MVGLNINTAVRRNIRREAAAFRLSGEQPDNRRKLQQHYSAFYAAAIGAMIVG